MPIEFNCNQCGRLLRTPDGTAGRQSKCPACGTIQPIPGAESSRDDTTADSEAPSGQPHAQPPPPPSPDGPGEQFSRPFGETLPYRGEDTPVEPPSDSPFAQAGAPASPIPPPTDSENPFAAPAEHSVDVQPTYQASTIQPTKVDISDVLSRAWELFKPQWLLCSAVFLVNWVLSTGFSYAVLGVAVVATVGANFAVANFAQFAANIVGQVFGLWLLTGMTLFMLRIARGQPPDFLDLFRGSPYLLTLILSGICLVILFLCVLAVLLIPAGIVGALIAMVAGGEAAMVIAIVVIPFFVIAMFYLMFMFSQFLFLIVDRNAGPIEALMLSRQITSGNKLMVFLLYLVGIPLIFVGMLACCVGYFPAMGFWSVAWAVQYLIMTGQPTGAQGLSEVSAG